MGWVATASTSFPGRDAHTELAGNCSPIPTPTRILTGVCLKFHPASQKVPSIIDVDVITHPLLTRGGKGAVAGMTSEQACLTWPLGEGEGSGTCVAVQARVWVVESLICFSPEQPAEEDTPPGHRACGSCYMQRWGSVLFLYSLLAGHPLLIPRSSSSLLTPQLSRGAFICSAIKWDSRSPLP